MRVDEGGGGGGGWRRVEEGGGRWRGCFLLSISTSPFFMST